MRFSHAALPGLALGVSLWGTIGFVAGAGRCGDRVDRVGLRVGDCAWVEGAVRFRVGRGRCRSSLDWDWSS